ncbi:MAG: transposase [Polyangiaceae bacterium]
MARKIKRRARYTAEFKAEALRAMHERGDRTIAEVAAGLGVQEHLLHSWKARSNQPPAPSDRGETPEEELVRLRREVADLKRDRDALAKSIAVFVRDRK